MKTNSILLSLALFFCLGVQTSAYCGPKTTFDVPKAQAEKMKAKVNSGEFSLSSFAFVENKGQVYGFDGLPHPEVKFSFQQGNTQIFLLEKGIAYQFTRIHYPEGYQEKMRDKGGRQDMERMMELQKQIRTETYRMDMTLIGANVNAEITTEGKSADYTNFYNHNVLNVHSYNKVTYHNIYPGIDWVIYTKNNSVKYDFVVNPGADPYLIKMQFDHQENLDLNKDGSFTLRNCMGNITEKAPISFQRVNEIKTRFLINRNMISFGLDNYASNEEIRIDPSLLWATYYGSMGYDGGSFCSTDQLGNIYLSGSTVSGSSISAGGHQNSIGGMTDGFLVKFNSSGVRQWATYYGGTGDDFGEACSNDNSGNVYLVGRTNSSAGISNFGHQNSIGGGWDAYVVKFNNNGVRQWSSYYGGAGVDLGFSCTTDPSGNVFLSGVTSSSASISFMGFQNAYGLSSDAFLVKFNSSGIRQWATYYGSSGYDEGKSCTTDLFGNVFLTGQTQSSGLIATTGSHQYFSGSPLDAYLVKFNSAGVRQWGTYYGGSGDDFGLACTTDLSGNVCLVGYTQSTFSIATASGHQNSIGGSEDAFLVKFNQMGVRQWGTYYGGAYTDRANSCSLDTDGNVFLVGKTTSTTGIASGGFQNIISPGGADAFLAKFNPLGQRVWGSYYGGIDEDSGLSCSTSSSGALYIAGFTTSTASIASNGHQNNYGGGTQDAFLVKFCDNLSQPSTISGNTVICLGAVQTYSVINDIGATSYSWTAPGGWIGTSTTNVISLTAGASGVFSVSANIACGASPVQTINVMVNPLPTVSVNSGTICSGQSFTIISSGANTYTFQGGNSVVSPNTSASYTVSGSSSDGCVSANTATANISVNPLPVINITAISTIICVGETIELSATGANSYTWSTGANNSSITVSPANTTTYVVTGEDANACENTSAFTLQVDECTGIANTLKSEAGIVLYPNPNNGMFYIETSQSLAVSIYNSLGQLIIQQKLSEGKNQINLNEHANSIYLIEINQNGKTNRMKLIKE